MINIFLFIFIFFTEIFFYSQPAKWNSDIIKIQRLEDFSLDGSFKEWENVPLRKLYADPYGKFPEQGDLSAEFKIAWKGENLLLYIKIEDDSFTADSLYPWRGDAVELFLTDYRGSENIIHYSLVTGAVEGNEAFCRIKDGRKSNFSCRESPGILTHINKEGNVVILEVAVDYSVFNPLPEDKTLGFQMYIDDSDIHSDDSKNQLTWYPLGHSYMNSFASFQLELSERENTLRKGDSRVVITDNKRVELFLFDTEKGDSIRVGNKVKHFDFFSTSSTPFRSEVINLKGFDPEKDTLWVYNNSRLVGIHDLFLSPRNYENEERNRFEREIRVFRKRDMLNMPEEGGVLFIGSSSIRMWNTVYMDFPELEVIHRGFGGSVSEDALKYMEYIVLPYNPSVIVYYEGDNDIPYGLSYEEIISNMKNFIDLARKNNPGIKIYMISPKPSLARMHLWTKYKELHSRMKSLVAEYSYVFFVDVSSPMFSSDGSLREEIFVEDGVHMNEAGYIIWRDVLRNKMNLD